MPKEDLCWGKTLVNLEVFYSLLSIPYYGLRKYAIEILLNSYTLSLLQYVLGFIQKLETVTRPVSHVNHSL